tara:strand:- start:461 stop:673 length:213 start_codon:yes stop_codon:yes gene_type:complete
MGGMGIYVWTAFIISFVVCSIFYYKTRRTLKKYEKEFVNEIEKLSISEKKTVLKNSKIANKVFSSYKELA